ncbi:MAG TPA: hypothetical protein ENN67_03540 [Firmicutes bacterium]|nr:hypothetical protein [Bacillota bacterium]
MNSITGNYLASPIAISGWIPEGEENPIDLTTSIGNFNFTTVFRDLDPLLRGSKFLPTGTGSLLLTLNGSKKLPEIAGTLDLADTTAGNAFVNAAHVDVSYSAGVVDLINVTAEAYEGSIEATGRINLLPANPTWQIDCTFANIDLAQYLDSNGYYAYEVNGPFSGTASGKGDFISQDSLQMDAEVKSSSGKYLSPFSSRFMNIAAGTSNPGKADESELTDYDDIQINLRVRESRINVDRLHFVSNDLQLEARGWIGFDHTLSGSGGFTIPLDKAKLHPKLRTVVALLPSSVNRVSLEFSIGGTLENVKINPKIGENFLKGVLDRAGDALNIPGNLF